MNRVLCPQQDQLICVAMIGSSVLFKALARPSCLLNVYVTAAIFGVSWSCSTHGTGESTPTEIECGEEGNCKLHVQKWRNSNVKLQNTKYYRNVFNGAIIFRTARLSK